MLAIQPRGHELGYLECMHKPGMTKHTAMLPLKGIGRWSPKMFWAVSSAETVHSSVKTLPQKVRWRTIKKDTRHGLLLRSIHTHTHRQFHNTQL